MILHAIVSGQVQGVGFRYWVKEEAEARGLTGWVRNLRDGRVELEAEGEEEPLRDFEQKLWRGPTLARVTNVECHYHDTTTNHTGFSIMH